MIRLLALLPLLLLSLPASAATKSEPRMQTLVVYGQDPCPRSSNDEIVVCARQPESERYRIPKGLRRTKQEGAAGGWAGTVRVLEYVSRQGLPDSCSPVGSGGQTGCFRRFAEQARLEREHDAQQ